MSSSRRGLSSVYGFIVIFTLLMAGIGATLTIMESQAAISNAQDRARQIEASQQGERLTLNLNGTTLTVGNIGLNPSRVLYLFQKGASTSSESKVDGYLHEGSNLTLQINAGMADYGVITSLGNTFWVSNSTITQAQLSTVPVTFDASGLGPSYGSSAILSVDGTPYDYSSLPKTFQWAPGGAHSYSFVQGFSTGSGGRVGWSGARGLSSSMTGTVTASQTGSIIATYSQQYLLTVTGGSSVQFVGSPSADGWYNSGSTGQFNSSFTWSSATGSRQNLYSFSLDGSSPTVVSRYGSGTYTSVGIPMSAPHTATLSAVTQYRLNSAGGNEVTLGGAQTGDGWFDSGSAGAATTNNVWNVTIGQSRMNLVSWNIDGGAIKGVPRAASGTFTTGPVMMNTSHTVNFGAVTQYYVTAQDNVPSNGVIAPVPVGYAYTEQQSSGQLLSNPGFEAGAGGWSWYNVCGPGTLGAVTSPVHSGTYSLQINDTNYPSSGTCMVQTVGFPSGSQTVSGTVSGWVYQPYSHTNDFMGELPCEGISGQFGPIAQGTWVFESFSISPGCGFSGALYFILQEDNYVGYWDDLSWSMTWKYPVSGSASSSANSFSVSGTTVTYTYGIGYSFPGGSSSTTWFASTSVGSETYLSNTCGISPSGGSISGTSSQSCTMTTSYNGSHSSTIAPSQTEDSWYDSGSSVSVSSSESGAFVFSSWSGPGGSLAFTSAGSASTTITVNGYGVATANLSVQP